MKRWATIGALAVLGQLFVVPGALALSNQLRGHSSPYLALHADDPVAWQDWNDAAVRLGRRENKLLYVSIGYFSCHWCHVMQRESYRDPAIARLLNERFIPIKVDRELEPALDARMIEFVEATRGVGGWPLNVFITPDGHPLYATLYHPPEEFLAILQRIDNLWQHDRAALAGLARQAVTKTAGPGRPRLERARVVGYVERLLGEAHGRADPVHGGFGDQSKFPMAPQLDFLLAEQARMPNPQTEALLLLTLDQMRSHGLHDHIGGGFFRYTVDPAWRTPHFEKMLYDNALLAGLYLRAASVFGRDDYRQVALRTLDFLNAEMRTPEGAFIAALSALDARGTEGGYYLWSDQDLGTILSARERRVYKLAAGMHDAPPFDAGFLPMAGLPVDRIAADTGLAPAQVNALIARAEQKLRTARARRAVPRDTKVLAAWNGLALAAFAQAARVTGRDDYRASAQGVRDYLQSVLWDGRALRRAVVDGRPLGKVALEDYAYVALGLTEWAELTGDSNDQAFAKTVALEAWRRFYGPDGWRLQERSLITPDREQDLVPDGPMPSPSGVVAAVSLRLATRAADKDLRERALAALNSGHALLREDPFWHATSVAAMRLAIPGGTDR